MKACFGVGHSFVILCLVFGLAPSPVLASTITVYGLPGFDGTPSSPNGTDGGDANNSVSGFYDYVYAYGGKGGNGYLTYDDAGSYIMGAGGNGGLANASAEFSAIGNVTSTVIAVGGASGYAISDTPAKGGIATANINVKSVDGSALDLSVIQKGGDGTGVLPDFVGGVGANSHLMNAATGYTSGALTLRQTAVGGNGGDGAVAGVGGDASSLMELSNLELNPIHSSSITLHSTAMGGNGGIAGGAGQGGNAESHVRVNDEAASSVLVNSTAIGGESGISLGGGPTKGGDAIANAVIETIGISGGSGREINSVSATGGNAGWWCSEPGCSAEGSDAKASFVGSAYGTIGASVSAKAGNATGLATGGSAEASGDIIVTNPLSYSSGNYSKLELEAVGGAGGSVWFGGDGGAAKVSGSAVVNGHSADSMLDVSIRQIGGSGGFGSCGESSGRGGNGADSILNAPVAFSTYGMLRINQESVGGTGMDSVGASSAGNGGDATSILSLGSTVSPFHSSKLDLTSTANAGQAGNTIGWNAWSPGTAGDAESKISIIDDAATSIVANSIAYAGGGGSVAQNGYNPTNGGNAFSNVDIASFYLGGLVSATSSAFGGMAGKNSWEFSIAQEASAGSGEAIARAEGRGRGNQISSFAEAGGGSAHASTFSTIRDLNGDKLVAIAEGSGSNTTLKAASNAVAGATAADNYSFSNGYNAISNGNITRSSDVPIVFDSLGTATGHFTQIADGLMGAQHSASEGIEAYSMSASYSFTHLSPEKSMLFSLTASDVLGSGFSSLTFSLSKDGRSLMGGTYTSLESWEQAMSLPLNLGKVSAGTLLTLSLSELLTDLSSGYKMNFVFAVAPWGTVGGEYLSTSSVPLPSAAPLFLFGIIGGGWTAYCKRRR